MAWLMLIIAGLFEVVWAFSLKQSAGFTRPVPTAIALIAMMASIGLLALSMRTLPLGTAYTVWTGIGAVGTCVVGVTIVGEDLNITRVIAAIFIVCGLALMKMASPA